MDADLTLKAGLVALGQQIAVEIKAGNTLNHGDILLLVAGFDILAAENRRLTALSGLTSPVTALLDDL